MADIHLEIEGIQGESKDKVHPNTIEVESFSWGVTNSGAHEFTGGGGTGVANFHDLSFSAAVNSASPLLVQACATGMHINKAVLYARKQGKEQKDFYTITLNEVLVSSYQSSDHKGGSPPQDTFSLSFAKIKYEYKPQNPDGTLGGAKTATWDIRTKAE